MAVVCSVIKRYWGGRYSDICALILCVGQTILLARNINNLYISKLSIMVKLETVWSSPGWFSKPFFVEFLSLKEPPGGDAVDDDLSWSGLTQTLGMTVEKLRNWSRHSLDSNHCWRCSNSNFHLLVKRGRWKQSRISLCSSCFSAFYILGRGL